MLLETIKRRGYAQQDRADAEESVATATEADPEPFICAYLQDRRSFGGRYIAADLFKETFAVYRQSKDSRNRYNTPVHNTAAVLAAEQLRRVLADTNQPERNLVVFLTGIPGAGKTSSVLSSNTEMPPMYRAIFEGQLSRLETTQGKIQQVLDAGLEPVILVVHVLPEIALGNVITRYYEEGRGASINVMSDIQGNLSGTLAKVHQHFGTQVQLFIQDNRDRSNPRSLSGWSQLAILETEGTHDEIKQRLSIDLERRRENGTVSDGCYQQAIGGTPIERDEHLDGIYQQKHQADGRGRGVPAGDRQRYLVAGISKRTGGRRD
jgi:hypothetical protein